MVSSFENLSEINQLIRTKRNEEEKIIPCSKVLKSYSLNMEFVDKTDMLKKPIKSTEKVGHRYFGILFMLALLMYL